MNNQFSSPERHPDSSLAGGLTISMVPNPDSSRQVVEGQGAVTTNQEADLQEAEQLIAGHKMLWREVAHKVQQILDGGAHNPDSFILTQDVRFIRLAGLGSRNSENLQPLTPPGIVLKTCMANGAEATLYSTFSLQSGEETAVGRVIEFSYKASLNTLKVLSPDQNSSGEEYEGDYFVKRLEDCFEPIIDRLNVDPNNTHTFILRTDWKDINNPVVTIALEPKKTAQTEVAVLPVAPEARDSQAIDSLNMAPVLLGVGQRSPHGEGRIPQEPFASVTDKISRIGESTSSAGGGQSEGPEKTAMIQPTAIVAESVAAVSPDEQAIQYFAALAKLNSYQEFLDVLQTWPKDLVLTNAIVSGDTWDGRWRVTPINDKRIQRERAGCIVLDQASLSSLQDKIELLVETWVKGPPSLDTENGETIQSYVSERLRRFGTPAFLRSGLTEQIITHLQAARRPDRI